MYHAMPRDPRDRSGRTRLADYERELPAGEGSFTGSSSPRFGFDNPDNASQATPRDDYVSFLEQELTRLRSQTQGMQVRMGVQHAQVFATHAHCLLPESHARMAAHAPLPVPPGARVPLPMRGHTSLCM